MSSDGAPAGGDHNGAPASSSAGTPESLATPSTGPTHCPYRQTTLLQQALSPDKMRVAFFLGAGCAAAIPNPDAGGTGSLIPGVAGLTERVKKALEESDRFKAPFQAVLKRLAEIENAEPNVERILTLVRSLREVTGKATHEGLSTSVLDDLDAEICSVTTRIVEPDLPSDSTPYHQLATWISAIQRMHAVEVFTPNYDLLMEQALEERRVPYFDGFVGSNRTFFDLVSMEHDTLPSRWARLWKVHGSINWWRTSDGHIERRDRRAPKRGGDRQMIFPSHLKYEQSRRMPYLAMLDRLRSFLGQGQAVVVTCGFSFSDQHLNEAILQGLGRNPHAIAFGLLYGDRANYPEALEAARKQANLNLLAADGAVVGTLERDWISEEKTDHPLNRLAVRTGLLEDRSVAPAERCKCVLGDFRAFGDFLALQLAQRDVVGSESNAG